MDDETRLSKTGGPGGNVFADQPEFVKTDPRAGWHSSAGYNLDPAFMRARHALLLPRQIIENRRVLDLGSCNAASGAWCLSNGASYYRGVELQEAFASNSAACLAKYYPGEKWDIRRSSIEDYLATEREMFDVVFAAGVLYGLMDHVTILNAMAGIARVLIVESMHPKSLSDAACLTEAQKKSILRYGEYRAFIENEPFIALGKQGMVVPGARLMVYDGARPSMGAVKYIVTNAGFRYVDDMNRRLAKLIPKKYSPTRRFGLLFVRDDGAPARNGYGFRAALSGEPSQRRTANWSAEALAAKRDEDS